MSIYDFIAGESPKAKTSSNATDFANQYGSIADQVGQKLGVSPDLILSQLALETGYGKSVIPGTNNLGNIKDFSGGGVAATDNMTGSRDKYRQYDTPEDFANDYADLLSRKYKGIIGAGDNADKFIAGLRGYAEDPNYGNKIKSVLANIKGTPRAASEVPQATPAAQTRPGYMSDDPFDPFSTNPIQYGAKPESQGFVQRAAESFGKGSGQLIKGLGWLVQSDTVQGLGDRATQYWSQKLEQDPETMKQLKAVTDAKGFWDSAKEVVTNPRALSDFIFSSLPAQAVGMGAGALTSRAVNSLAYNMALKAGATEGVAFEAAQMAAAKAAQSAAVKAGSATNMAAEGVTQGAMSGAETEDYLVSQGMPREQAHAEALKTAAQVGISTAALSGLTAGMETRAAMGVGNKSGVKAVAGSAGKGALEEGAQNVSQEYFETGAKQQVTPGYEADYGKAFATGALTGGVMSGGTHALGNIAARPEPVIPTVEALNQQSSEIAKAKIDDIGKATTVDQAVQSFTEAATQPLQIDRTPLDTARQVVQQMEAERVAAPVAPVQEAITPAPVQEISQPELPQATPQEKESQVKSAIATPAMREMMGKLPAEQRAEVLNLSNQAVSGSLESRAPAIERLHQIMSDNGALTTTGKPIAQPKQNIQELKEQVKSIVSTPEWTAHLQTLSPSERTFANEVVNSVNNPKLPAGYRSMLAEVVNDYNAQLPKQAKANEPAAMIADNNFEPEIGKLAYVAPEALPKAGEGLTQDKATAIQKLGKVFGKEVHFFNQEGSQTRLDGYADPKYKDAIFVNANKGDAAWHYVAGHEFFHQLDPQIKKSFIEAVAPLVPADRLGKLKEYINQGKLDEAGQWEEIGADLFGNRFGEEGFLGKALSGVKDTSTLMKMVNAIRDFVTKVLASAKEQGFATDRFVSDLDKVRAAAEEALKQHLNQEKIKDVSEPSKAQEETAQAKTAEDTQARANKILDDAGIKGKERIEALKDVKAGTITPEELASAYPASDEVARIKAEKEKAFTEREQQNQPKEKEIKGLVEAGRDAKVEEAETMTKVQGFDEAPLKTATQAAGRKEIDRIRKIPEAERTPLQQKFVDAYDAKLSSERKEITNTPEFKKWFGDSKVVDADGNPMVVYHGNADDFAEFKDVGWSKKDQGWLGRGFYFTTSKNTASSYANLKSGMADPNVMPVYLSLKNPFVATMRDKESGMFAEKRGDKEMPFKKRDELIEKGHDGVVLHYRGDDGEIRESEYVVFNSNQIKSAIGNNGEFDASNPDIRMSVARNSIPLYQENKSIPDTLKEVAKDLQLAVDAAKGLLTSGKPQSELVETIVTNLFDSTNTMEQIARRTGKNEAADKFLTTQKLYKAASQKVVNDAVKEYADPMLEKLQTEWKDKYSKMAWYKETGYKQFLNDIGTIGNLVKHGPERNADIARKTEGKDQAGSGRTNEEIAQIEKDIRREAPGLIELYEDIYKNNLKPMIDIGNNAKRESGLITPEMEAARQNYEWYVPLYGDPSEFDNTNVGSGGGGLKSIKDKNAMGRSGTLADNVMQNVLKQMSSAVQQAGSQELKSALVDWVKSSPAAKLAMGARINDAGTREIFEKYTGPDGLVHERVKPGAAISPTAMVYKNGNETTVIDFKNAKVIESLNGNKPIEGILSGVQKATRLMGAVFTRYNPIFPVMNKLRDSQSQISFVMADAPVENKFKAAQDTLANNLKFSVQWGKNESPEYTEWKEKFEKLGGATMYADILHDDVMKNIEREFAVQVDNKLIANKLANRLGKVIDGVNEHMEMSSRIAMFKALVDNGMTERDAALYTKNTMNFETKGKWGQQLGAIYTFAGPALFDARRMAQSLRTPRGALVMAAQFGMMFGLYGALKSLAGDDEDGVNRLNKIPVNQSGRFLTFVSEDGTGYKIPVGFGYSRIALTLAASLHRYIDGVDDIGHFAQNVAVDGLISNFSVIEPKDISIKKDAMGWAMQTFLPTITQPMYQVAANQNFQGGPIHKPDEWTGSKLRFEQAWPNTPELFRDAAKNIYDATGIDVYPETLSHLTRSYGGNGVMDVVRAFQLVGEKAEKDWTLADIPAAQGFASRASSQDANNFRQKFEEAQKLDAERKYAMKEGNLADFDAEHPDMIRDLSIYKAANKVIKELYTQRKAVAGTDDAKAINDRIRSIQMRANKEAAAN